MAAVLIIDDSDHGRAGEWFAACIGDAAPVEIVGRDAAPAAGADWRAVIITGSEHSVFEEAPWLDRQMALIRALAATATPLLGVCFGHQLIFRALYGKDVLARRAMPEVGWPPVRIMPDELFAGLGDTLVPYNFHTDEVIIVPAEWQLLASSAACRVHAARHRARPWWGLQFHPEVTPAEGVAGLTRGANYLAVYGLDAAEIIKGASGGRHYPEIILNFIRAAASGARKKLDADERKR